MSLASLVRRLLDRPYLLLTLATLSWGGNAVAGRLAVGEVSPMAVVSLRWFFVVVVLGLTARGTVLSELPRLRADWPRIILMGALGYTAFNAIFYWAAHLTTAVNMGVLQGVTPAMVLAISFAAYGTRAGPLQLLGLAATLAGTLVVASRGEWEVLRHLSFNLGDLGIVVASLLYAGYTVGLRRRPAVSPLTLFTAMASAAFASSLPLLAWEIADGSVLWPGREGWLLILYIALIPSLVAQLFFMRGVALIGPGRAGLFMNLIPVFAAILGVVLLGETFAAYHALALALVLGGIWLAERRPAPQAAPAETVAPGTREP